VQMPGMTGLELHRRLVASGRPIPTILITAYPDERMRAQALNAGVICYLTKPFNESELLACIHSALGDQRTES
jgi:FixJ family two-component response regulator